jgi:sugar phosphate isomerase/epimerase
MELGIFAKTFPRPTLDETLDAVVKHGFSQIQFNMSCMGLPTLPDRLDEASCVWIARSLHERGLAMAAISGTFNMCDPVESHIEHNLRRLDVLAGACRWLDTRIITLCTGTRDRDDMWKWHPDNVTTASWNRLVETMREAVKIADRHEVTLAFEPEVHNVVSSVMRARRLLDEIASPWLKVVIDPVNLFPSGDITRLYDMLYEAIDWLGADIVLAHAKEPPEIEGFAESLRGHEDRVFRALDPEAADVVQHAQLQAEERGWSFTRSASWSGFYNPYLTGLLKSGFDGALVLHGLKEVDVAEALGRLRASLKLASEMGDPSWGSAFGWPPKRAADEG